MAERVPLYLDFETGNVEEFGASDTLPEANAMALPVGAVLPMDSNTNPAAGLGYGSWASIGTQVIGAVTVYYFQRQD